MPETETTTTKHLVWNAGRTVGAKRALFDLAIGSKLRGCDLVRMKIGDIVNAGQFRTRAVVMQQKTTRPVQFEILPDARARLLA